MSRYLRVHIIPVGYDSTRITEPLMEKRADKVYFMRNKGDKGYSKYFDFIKKEIREKMKGLEYEEVFVNIWDLFECIEKFREIITNEKGNHIFINVSTGSKISSIAGMLSCMLIENVEPYYVEINYPSQKDKKKLQKDVVKCSISLPVYEIKKPRKEHMEILRLLSDKGKMRKTELIEELEIKKTIKIKDPRIEKLSNHAKHSQLKAILFPMEKELGYVKVERVGKRSDVSITEQGIQALRIFGC